MIKVIDNVISSVYQDRLEDTFLSTSVSWTLNQSLTEMASGSGEAGFAHPLINPEYRSEYFNYVLPLVYEISEKSGVNVRQILLARSFLQLPTIGEYENDLFHVDVKERHMVFLYYVNDSDGDTLITNQKYIQNKKQFFPRNYKMQIQERVTPKKGRVVVFDGMLFHAAGIPKRNTRCVLNFDIVP